MKNGIIIVLGFMVVLLAGCGGGGSDSQEYVVPDPVVPTVGAGEVLITGHVMDAYLDFATVFLDYNDNFALDAGEPFTTTGKHGVYNLAVPAGDENLHRVVAIVGQYAVDEDEMYKADGSFNYLGYSFVLSSPVGQYATLSPITTLVTLDELAGSTPAQSYTTLENDWLASTGSLPNILLNADYVAGYQGAVANGQSALANEYDMLHKLNRVLVFAFARAFDGAANGVLGTNQVILNAGYNVVMNLPTSIFDAAFASYPDFDPRAIAISIGLNDTSLNGF